jgi:hypothetical protein
MKTPTHIFVHHTAVSYDKNPDQWNATNNYHKEKWNMKSSLGYYAGYNYEISKAGSIKQFRADGETTVAQYQQNMNDGRAISICLDGAFDTELPTDDQVKVLYSLIETKMKQYNIKRENIFPHRHVAKKSCWGNLLPDDVMGYLEERLKALEKPTTPAMTDVEWFNTHITPFINNGQFTPLDREAKIARALAKQIIGWIQNS